MKSKTLVAVLFAIGFAGVAPVGVLAHEKSAPKAAAGMQMDPKMQQPMTERMKQMQGEMQRIHETKDPAEQAKLMQDHMKHMQEGMQMMRGMGGAGRQGMPMMEQRMDMMQMMMEQMMQHQEMMQPRPAK